MSWLIEIVARYLYRREFARFDLPGGLSYAFAWSNEPEDNKESWRKEARRLVVFWRSGGGT